MPTKQPLKTPTKKPTKKPAAAKKKAVSPTPVIPNAPLIGIDYLDLDSPDYANNEVAKAMKFFPLAKPRPQQVEAITKVLAAFDSGAQYVVLEAPPGVGKSAIGVTLARYFGEAYFCTLTEQLQEQYLSEFSALGMKVLKGRGKYHCTQVNGTCADAAIVEAAEGCAARGICPYTNAKKAAFASPLMIANYHSFVANIGQAIGEDGESPMRKLMVLDECHTVENFLLDYVGLTIHLNKISLPNLPELPDQDRDAEPYYLWLNKVLPRLKELKLADPREKEQLHNLIRKIDAVLIKAASKEVDFIVERGRDMKTQRLDTNWFALKPLTVKEYGKWVWGYGHKLLLMSATVLDAGILVKNLGLDPEKGEFVQLGSSFPKENRQIVVSPLNMSRGARDESWPAMMAIIEGILSHHSKEKGLLLCPSNEMLHYIRKNLGRVNSQRLILAFGEDRKAKYQEHLSTRMPSVLAASGYWEGADLKDNASRFQLIPSVPRAFWSGQIKARAQMEPKWYRWINFTKLIQGLGRSVRSETDEAITYLFDRDFLTELDRKDSLIPPWVAEAVQRKGAAAQ